VAGGEEVDRSETSLRGGDFDESDFSQWQDDITAAIEELKRRVKIPRVFLVGLRLGGTLTLQVGAGINDLSGVVLWDPIVNGVEHLDELRAMHIKRYRTVKFIPPPKGLDDSQLEILGFSLKKNLIQSLNDLDLFTSYPIPAPYALLIESNPNPQLEGFGKHLSGLGAQVTYTHQPGPLIWTMDGWRDGIIPTRTIQEIVDWFPRVVS